MILNKEDQLFHDGMQAFNDRRFYDAHEFWEELWLEYKLEDANFIQGLIQLAVSYFHLFNNNLNGARSMIAKCLVKFENFELGRGMNVNELKEQVKQVQEHFNNITDNSDIIDSYILTLKVIHELWAYNCLDG